MLNTKFKIKVQLNPWTEDKEVLSQMGGKRGYIAQVSDLIFT